MIAGAERQTWADGIYSRGPGLPAGGKVCFLRLCSSYFILKCSLVLHADKRAKERSLVKQIWEILYTKFLSWI